MQRIQPACLLPARFSPLSINANTPRDREHCIPYLGTVGEVKCLHTPCCIHAPTSSEARLGFLGGLDAFNFNCSGSSKTDVKAQDARSSSGRRALGSGPLLGARTLVLQPPRSAAHNIRTRPCSSSYSRTKYTTADSVLEQRAYLIQGPSAGSICQANEDP